LHEVALGRQTVDVWKDARMLGATAGEAAVRMCAGVTVDEISGTTAFKTSAGNTLNSILLDPIPITREDLNVVLEAGWITKEALCQGVAAGSVAACP
jgi:D-xylose transport system substrate-binding protein